MPSQMKEVIAYLSQRMEQDIAAQCRKAGIHKTADTGLSVRNIPSASIL